MVWVPRVKTAMTFYWIHCFYLVILLSLLDLPVLAQPQSCSANPDLEALQNTQFENVNGQTVWGACSYPNPQSNWTKCGRSEKSWLCDPDGLLELEDGLFISLKFKIIVLLASY